MQGNKKVSTIEPPQIRGRTCLPYVKGVSERLKRILEKAGVQAALKPCQTLTEGKTDGESSKRNCLQC